MTNEELEHRYLQKQLIEDLGQLDLTLPLTELMASIQTLLDNSRFTTIHDPVSIHKLSAAMVDNITEAIKRGDRITGKSTGWLSLDRILGGWNAGDFILLFLLFRPITIWG